MKAKGSWVRKALIKKLGTSPRELLCVFLLALGFRHACVHTHKQHHLHKYQNAYADYFFEPLLFPKHYMLIQKTITPSLQGHHAQILTIAVLIKTSQVRPRPN